MEHRKCFLFLGAPGGGGRGFEMVANSVHGKKDSLLAFLRGFVG